MVPVRHVLEFAVLAAVLIAIPGPSVLFIVSRALTVGRRPALFTVAGNELGGCVQVAAVAFGVGALVERSAEICELRRAVEDAGHRRPGGMQRFLAGACGQAQDAREAQRQRTAGALGQPERARLDRHRRQR